MEGRAGQRSGGGTNEPNKLACPSSWPVLSLRLTRRLRDQAVAEDAADPDARG